MSKTSRVRSYSFLAMFLVLILSGCPSMVINPDLDGDDVTVIMTVPADGAAGIPVNSGVSATFSAIMDPATVDAASFTLSSAAGQVTGSVELIGVIAIFVPASDLAFNTVFTATITTAVRDADGDVMLADKIWSFTTDAAPDAIAPTITGESPADMAAGVATTVNPTATFSEAVASATMTGAASAFTLEDTTSAEAVAIAGVVSLDGLTATFNPDSDLTAGSEYTARISTALEDIAGNPLAVDYSWTFTTAGRRPVMLKSAGDFVMLATTSVTDGATTTIHGAIGLDAPDSGFTGFAQVMDVSGTFSRAFSATITGNMYASNYTEPTPAYLAAAIVDMAAAYADVNGREGGTALDSGELGGRTLSAGLYSVVAAAAITTTLTLDGGPEDIYIFQIGGALTMAASIQVLLPNGVLPKNICWQTDGAVTIGASAVFPGIVLSNADITLGASVVVNGRLFASAINTIAGSASVLEPAP